MKQLTSCVLLALALTLTGCGGGGSNNETTENNTTDSTSETKSNNTTLTNSSYVEGIYNIEVSNDEAYVVIATDGTLTTYDFMGDSVDNGNNCYKKNPDNLNALLNGKKLTHDAINKRFTLESYNWVYNTSTEITNVSNGGISAGSVLSMNGIRIATATKKVTSPSINDMEQSLCQ